MKRLGSYPLLSEPGNKNANNYVEFNDMLQRRLSECRIRPVNATVNGDNHESKNFKCVANRSFKNMKEDKTTEICISFDSPGTMSRLQDNQGYLSDNNSLSDNPGAPICFSKGQNPLAYGGNPVENGQGSHSIRPLVADNRIPVDADQTRNEVSGDDLDSDGVRECYVVREFSKVAGAEPDNVLRKEWQVRSPRVVSTFSTSSMKSPKCEERIAPLGVDIVNASYDNEIPSPVLSEGTDDPIYDYIPNRINFDCSDSERGKIGCDAVFTDRSLEEELSHYVKNFSFTAFSQSPETISRLRVSSTDSGVGESRVQPNLQIPQSPNGAAGPYERNKNTICSDSGPRKLRAAGARSRQSILSLGLSFRSIYDSLSLDVPQPLITTSCDMSPHLYDSLTMVTSLSTAHDVTCVSTPSGQFSQCTCGINNSIFGETSSFDRTEYSTILGSADQSGHLDHFDRCNNRNMLDTSDHLYECINADTDISHVVPSDSESTIYENPDFLLRNISNHESSA
jgi:hypothetical protein